MADEGSDCDVPPLEDMSELLQQLSTIREDKSAKTTQKTSTNAIPSPQHSAEGHICNPPNDVPDVSVSKGIPPQAKQASKGKKQTETFGGMKKGFLFGSSGKTSTSSKPCAKPVVKDDIPFIKAKNPDSKQATFEFSEVQEAMKASQAFTKNTDWVTEDLLKKVQGNESVMHKLADPLFMQAVTEFQTNPQAAMAKYQSNSEIQNFLKNFCGILGDHFSSLASQQPGQTMPSGPTGGIATHSPGQEADIRKHIDSHSRSASHEDEQRMQEILGNPEIWEILMDRQIQQFIESLRNNPDKAQSVVRSADTNLRQKIHKLIDAGLLQIQR